MNHPELLDVDYADAGGQRQCRIPAKRTMPDRRGVGLWGILLVLVIVFGYLTASRRRRSARSSSRSPTSSETSVATTRSFSLV